MKKPTFLRERVAFDEVVETPDGSGGKIRSWEQRLNVRADFIYARGSEAIDAARLQGRSVYKVKIRSSAASRAITAGWRMRDVRRGLASGLGDDALPGNRYNIREVDAITDPAWVYIVVELGVAV
ncbi:head-tail adaptor protein [Rhodobacter sp. NTK016B]|uniref:phage head completion protein n=1 Tax=Rhodobacter sp. NTK016B TaxID=2759676 RepID=UPI001A906916|nr:head-tail adaptor protein [Rhodobacter sp. NTK016B]MBN8292817.1 head-tail adaptor protein [Rhodobacter sp. NTK016B]